MIEFADVSFYQGSIDFDKMKAKAPCVIIRAGQGLWIDNKFSDNWESAKLSGLSRACYWFYDSRVKPSTQMEYLSSALSDDAGEGVIWLDIEDTYGGAYHGWKYWAAMLDLMTVAFPDKKLGIYTAPYYWMQNMIGAPSASVEWFSKFLLWIANYQVSTPLIPAPFTEQAIWQYGTPAVGLEWGVESKEIDMNKMDDKFYSLCFGDSVSSPVEPPVETEPPALENKQVKVTAPNGLNIRSGAGTESEKFAAVWSGQTVEIEEERYDSNGDKWGRLANAWICFGTPGYSYVEDFEPATRLEI